MTATPKIKEQFGSWFPLIEELIVNTQILDKVFSFLKSEVGKKKEIFPKSSDVFNSFQKIDRHKIKALIILQDPYNTKTKEGVVIANGMPLSCRNIGKLQSSLQSFYEAIEEQYLGFNIDMDMRADNSYLFNEGVMLLNKALTVEYMKPGSHCEIWSEFMRYFIENVINVYYKRLPIVLIGKQAQQLDKYINPLLHYVLKVEHPSLASRENRKWKYNDMFKWVDNIIEANNGISERIRWYRIKGEDKVEDMPEWVTNKRKEYRTESRIGEKEFKDLPWDKIE